MLSKHLEALFALAQVVTPTPDHAVQLVRDTFRRAEREGLQVGSEEAETRVLLLKLLMDESVSSPFVDRTTELQSVRRRLADRIVDRILPAAFASLSREDRVLLTLCDVEGLSASQAARVVGMEESRADRRLAEARSRLRQTLYSSATPSERQTLSHGIGGNWMQSALRRVIEAELSAVPPTLAPSLTSPAVPGPAEKAPEPQREERGSLGRVLKRAAAVLLIITVAGLLGYGFSTMTSRAPDVDLISLSANQAGALEATFETASAEQAERYVRDRLGRRITVPAISEAALQGVSIRAVSDGAEAPVILYRNVDGESSIAVYVYSYAFLDQYQEQLQLTDDVLAQIEEEGSFDLHDLGDEKALVWRQRDDIYIAITQGDAESLRARITTPS